MKPSFEKVPKPPMASWTLLNRRLDDAIPFEWHHHPEYELTLTLNSRGHRYVGNDVAGYDDGDLVLVGPNVPHSWSSSERLDATRPHVALVIWFSQEWAQSLVALFPEMARLGPLLAAAHCAVQFSDGVAQGVRHTIEAMVEQPAGERLVSLLHVLLQLCQDSGASRIVPLDPTGSAVAVVDDTRIHRVLDYLHAHYTEPVAIADLARMACVSVSAFHRMFRRHARCTALDYIASLRIGRACSLLLEQHSAVALIAEQVGYASLALFNRQFKAQKGMTPSDFRRLHGHHFR